MTRAEIRSILLRDTWFASLPPALIEAIVERSIRRDFCVNAPIYRSGDPPTGQYAVLEGTVKLTSTTVSGKQVIYGLWRPSHWFGHLSVLDEKPRFQDAVATERAHVLFLPKNAFDAIVEAEPRYALDFSRLICQHIRIAMEMLAEALTAPLPARVAQALLEAADAPDPGCALATRMTQDGLAARVGVTRQSINRILKVYKARGLVDVRYGRIIVSDPQSLAALTRMH